MNTDKQKMHCFHFGYNFPSSQYLHHLWFPSIASIKFSHKILTLFAIKNIFLEELQPIVFKMIATIEYNNKATIIGVNR